MSTLYIVTEQAFDYNDEYYYQTDGSTPVKAYRKIEVAEKECFEKNCEWFSENNIGEYGYGSREIFDDPETIEDLTGVDLSDHLYDLNLESKFKELSDDDKRDFIAASSIKPFKVVEVELA